MFPTEKSLNISILEELWRGIGCLFSDGCMGELYLILLLEEMTNKSVSDSVLIMSKSSN